MKRKIFVADPGVLTDRPLPDLVDVGDRLIDNGVHELHLHQQDYMWLRACMGLKGNFMFRGMIVKLIDPPALPDWLTGRFKENDYG